MDGEKLTIAVGLSGGVDSSTAFRMLHDEGHDVFGITMRHLPKEMAKERVGSCCAPSSVAAAGRLAASLGRPHYVFGLEDEFAEAIMKRSARELAAGRTPNPCVWCNESIKFDALFRRAMALGADAFATGHYARVRDGRLFRAVDRARDQSYFLYRIKPEVLARTIFPLGELKKPEVRERARSFGIEMADKEDSMDVCFAPDGDFTAALARFAPDAMEPGDFVTEDGAVVGAHEGVGRYTIGQRRGLGVSLSEPVFVGAIDPSSRRIVVGPRKSITRFLAREPVFHAELPETFEAVIRIRSQHRGVSARVTREQDRLVVEPVEPQTGVTPGQSVVFYAADDRILGGAIIATS